MLAEKEVAAQVSSMDTDPIFIAIEMSRSKWLVGTHLPASAKVGIHAMDWGDTAALFALIDRLKLRAAEALGVAEVPILCCYEAGYEGFWLHRRLSAAGHCVLVIDPASLLVNRRAKRAKTDRIDVKAMIRALMAYTRGEDQVLSAVQIPSVEQDDERRLMRERQRLVKERTAHTNRIKGLLLTQGIVGFDARADGADGQLDELVTGDGRRLGPRLKDEVRREIARLRLVMKQLAHVDDERDAVALPKRPSACDDARNPDGADAAMIKALARLKGVGPNDASVLVREAFWRKFANRREIAAWSGFGLPARMGADILKRNEALPQSIKEIAWKAQARLCARYRRLAKAGKPTNVVCVAIARELAAFVWAIATSDAMATVVA